MLSQPLNAILVLCLLFLSYCSATDDIPPIGSSSSSTRGYSIIAATCFNRMYNGYVLQLAAKNAKDLLDDMVDEMVDLKLVEYIPTPQERMPFSPPYYYHLINQEAVSFAADFVVITRDGRLAKVVTEVGPPPRFTDCEMRYA